MKFSLYVKDVEKKNQYDVTFPTGLYIRSIYRSLNTTVAQFKYYPFGVNTMIEIRNIKTTYSGVCFH